ncbi:hypothetical protein HGM15179_007093 [Zosterops borbonicus]|uniref:Ig-like domain-containing protein n=1 Tax=Zosterops borbonicus TaxID=364589 RepID=A0A8K1GLL9_9PASS|nr:hypothetical protein HGM15179_007093 [Zosterops borbonicus]
MPPGHVESETVPISGMTGDSQELTVPEAKGSLTGKEWQEHPSISGPDAPRILGIVYLRNRYFKDLKGHQWAFGITAVETEGIKQLNILPRLSSWSWILLNNWPKLSLCINLWMTANALWGWLQRWKEDSRQHREEPIWASEMWQDIIIQVEKPIVRVHHGDAHMPKSRVQKEHCNNEHTDQDPPAKVSQVDVDWQHKGELFLAQWAHDASAQTLGLAGAQTTQLLVEPPWMPAVLWDRVTLTCQGLGTAGDTTWYKDGQSWGQEGLDHFTVTESGTYTCDRPSSGLSTPVHVVNELFTVPVLEGPPEPTEGSPLNLSCLSTPSPLRPQTPLLHLFYRDGQLVGGPQGSPQLLVPAVGVSHSGNYSCQVHSEGGNMQKSSARLQITVRMPVANATITPGPLSHQVHAGDNVTLHCSVEVGSAPVTFTWLHNGQEVAQGPVLELGDVNVGHSGTYQCVATNQLGQDGHRVFRALSPELALEVTPHGHWAATKSQDRAPPEPLDAMEEGLDTHNVGTEQAGDDSIVMVITSFGRSLALAGLSSCTIHLCGLVHSLSWHRRRDPGLSSSIFIQCFEGLRSL